MPCAVSYKLTIYSGCSHVLKDPIAGKACASFLRKFGSCFSQFVENIYFNQKDIFLTYHLND